MEPIRDMIAATDPGEIHRTVIDDRPPDRALERGARHAARRRRPPDDVQRRAGRLPGDRGRRRARPPPVGGADIPAALQAYEAERKPRTAKFQNLATRLGNMGQMSNPVAVLVPQQHDAGHLPHRRAEGAQEGHGLQAVDTASARHCLVAGDEARGAHRACHRRLAGDRQGDRRGTGRGGRGRRGQLPVRRGRRTEVVQAIEAGGGRAVAVAGRRVGLRGGGAGRGGARSTRSAACTSWSTTPASRATR